MDEMNMERICPKCGRKYTAPPALSREDNETLLCPLCGTAESIGFLPEDLQKAILSAAENAEKNRTAK